MPGVVRRLGSVSCSFGQTPSHREAKPDRRFGKPSEAMEVTHDDRPDGPDAGC